MRSNHLGARFSNQEGFTIAEIMTVLAVMSVTGLMMMSIVSMSNDSQRRMVAGIESIEARNEISQVLTSPQMTDPVFCTARFKLEGSKFNNSNSSTLPASSSVPLTSDLMVVGGSGKEFRATSTLSQNSNVRIVSLKVVVDPYESRGPEDQVIGRVEMQTEEKNPSGIWLASPKKVLGSMEFKTGTSTTPPVTDNITECKATGQQFSCNDVGGTVVGGSCLIPSTCTAGHVEVVREDKNGMKYLNCEDPNKLAFESPPTDPICSDPDKILVKVGGVVTCKSISEYIGACPAGNTLVATAGGGSTCKSMSELLGLTCAVDKKFLVRGVSSCKNMEEFVGVATTTTLVQPASCDVMGPGSYQFGTATSSCRGAVPTSCVSPTNLGSVGNDVPICRGATATQYSCGANYTYTICDSAVPQPTNNSTTTTLVGAPAPTPISCAINGPGLGPYGGAYGTGSTPSCKATNQSTSCIDGVDTGIVSEPACPGGQVAKNYNCGSSYTFKICEPAPPTTTTLPLMCVSDPYLGYFCYPNPGNYSATTTTTNPTYCRTYYELPSGYDCIDQENFDEDGDGICFECRRRVQNDQWIGNYGTRNNFYDNYRER